MLGPVVTALSPGRPRTAASITLPLALSRNSRWLSAAMGTGERRISVVRDTPVTTTSASVAASGASRNVSVRRSPAARVSACSWATKPTALTRTRIDPTGRPVS